MGRCHAACVTLHPLAPTRRSSAPTTSPRRRPQLGCAAQGDRKQPRPAATLRDRQGAKTRRRPRRRELAPARSTDPPCRTPSRWLNVSISSPGSGISVSSPRTKPGAPHFSFNQAGHFCFNATLTLADRLPLPRSCSILPRVAPTESIRVSVVPGRIAIHRRWPPGPRSRGS